MFRPYNDVRFSKNRPPYKTQQGAYGDSDGGAGTTSSSRPTA